MRSVVCWGLLLGGTALVLFGGSGCVSSEQAEGQADDSVATRSETPRTAGPSLAPQDEDIRTVQLYRGENERNLPITSLQSPEPLTLEFDLMAQQGRPLSVYFVHANREWKRDLSPSQTLESYHDDRLVDYRGSQGTEVPYVHYEYRFPNDDIRFRVSGNYILRVTEQGRRDSVLFERPFFISDETGDLQLGAEALMVPGQRQRSLRPIARYNPPAALRGDPFGYTVCFVRNGRLPDTRCQGRPLLAQQPRLEFELDRDEAFAPITADYTVDLGDLRTGAKIERTNRTVSPLEVLLEPDYAQFSGRDLDAALNGQIVVKAAVDGRATPALTAEYVETTFAFVPPREQPLAGRVVVAGSFSGMNPAQGTRMEWRPLRGRYEGEILLKQGLYQYFYHTPDARLRDAVRRSQARIQSIYTSFVYYEDPSVGTDRLLRVNSVRR
ncbi:type IX secretion system plug protein domain-containing protein [Salinibacter sp. 10B]|uniref:type IX secretion system plug protein n=1 Tax=Salinibacter sp. 10B TaxID=1923971 RepID=UPI000CF385F9|nr:type IX secretion system plug protein domain-containing protein [Salinibacter sp. 10B]